MIIDTSTISKASQIEQAYAALKVKQQSLDRFYAAMFHLNQNVAFRSNGSQWNGEVESIGRTGRIRVKLTTGGIHGRYSHYTLGAASLHENLIHINYK
jgi:biotin-(acetyl-CoA carboxylase) ligase